MEAGADLQERRHAAADADFSAGRLGDAAQDLEQRALAGAVAADDADDLARLDREGDVLERPELGLIGRTDAPSALPLLRRRRNNRSASSRSVRALNCPSR